MMNIYFPDEMLEKDDVYFICYMIERVARRLHRVERLREYDALFI